MAVHSIPVVNGWRSTYEEMLPDGSFIHVGHYRHNLTQLAEYLNYLDKNESAYVQYHAWRARYEEVNAEQLCLCEICSKVQRYLIDAENGIFKSDRIRNIFTHFATMQTCVSHS